MATLFDARGRATMHERSTCTERFSIRQPVLLSTTSTEIASTTAGQTCALRRWVRTTPTAPTGGVGAGTAESTGTPRRRSGWLRSLSTGVYVTSACTRTLRRPRRRTTSPLSRLGAPSRERTASSPLPPVQRHGQWEVIAHAGRPDALPRRVLRLNGVQRGGGEDVIEAARRALLPVRLVPPG